MPDILTLSIAIGLVILANIVEKRENPIFKQLFIRMLPFLGGPLLLIGFFYVFTSPEQLAEAQGGAPLTLTDPVAYGITLQAMAFWTFLAPSRSFRTTLERRLFQFNSQSPVHVLAVLFSGLLMGNVALLLTQGGLDQLAETAVSASLLDVIGQQAIFVLMGLLGVGWILRRRWRDVGARLGLERPSARQLLIGLGWIALLVLLQSSVGAIWALLDPVRAEQLGGVNELLLADFDTWWEWLALATAAALGEELLFRGALQPILGLPATAVIFALGHVQYGFTPITVLILIIGLILGLIRQRMNTTVAIFVHFGYNFILGLIALLAPMLQ